MGMNISPPPGGPDAGSPRLPRDIRARLSAATAELHRLADLRAGSFDIRGETGLRGMLQFMIDGIAPVEAALDAAGAARLLPEWPERRRTPLLEEDGARAPRGASGGFGTEAEIWGALYVLEGSRLGSQLLARVAGGRSRFLETAAADGFWPEFLHRLREAHERLKDPEGMERGARAAFAVFIAAPAAKAP